MAFGGLVPPGQVDPHEAFQLGLNKCIREVHTDEGPVLSHGEHQYHVYGAPSHDWGECVIEDLLQVSSDAVSGLVLDHVSRWGTFASEYPSARQDGALGLVNGHFFPRPFFFQTRNLVGCCLFPLHKFGVLKNLVIGQRVGIANSCLEHMETVKVELILFHGFSVVESQCRGVDVGLFVGIQRINQPGHGLGSALGTAGGGSGLRLPLKSRYGGSRREGWNGR